VPWCFGGIFSSFITFQSGSTIENIEIRTENREVSLAARKEAVLNFSGKPLFLSFILI